MSGDGGSLLVGRRDAEYRAVGCDATTAKQSGAAEGGLLLAASHRRRHHVLLSHGKTRSATKPHRGINKMQAQRKGEHASDRAGLFPGELQRSKRRSRPRRSCETSADYCYPGDTCNTASLSACLRCLAYLYLPSLARSEGILAFLHFARRLSET